MYLSGYWSNSTVEIMFNNNKTIIFKLIKEGNKLFGCIIEENGETLIKIKSAGYEKYLANIFGCDIENELILLCSKENESIKLQNHSVILANPFSHDLPTIYLDYDKNKTEKEEKRDGLLRYLALHFYIQFS